MSIFAEDIAEIMRSFGSVDTSDDRPLGDRLNGRFADVEIDSVAAVREIREE